MHLVVRRLVARAHHAAAGLPALADPDAAPLGLGEVVVVVGIAEQRQQLSVLGRADDAGSPSSSAGGSTITPGFITRARIPDVLHLGKQRKPVGAVHPTKQFRARPPVAVFSGHRAAEGDHQIGGLLDERPVRRNAFAR